ncbi:MAG: carbon-nitrogen hydrolase family protein [Planctomycetota bacterium]
MIRISLANIRCPKSRDESVDLVLDTMKQAAAKAARIVCFPECFVPGYRIGTTCQNPDQDWLNRQWSSIDAKAAELGIGVILGTERIVSNDLLITARVTNPDGSLAGFQDKVQLDPSEESIYVAGSERRLFQCGELTFGVVICHEGWRYPETVRWAAQRDAHIVFHPHFEVVQQNDFSPRQFADPANTFHEKAALCRAAENTCYFATVNGAIPGAHTTSAVVNPDGVLVSYQPYGMDGILFAEIETELATGFLAKRHKSDFINAL